jgi:post-segregation antitoxin (ccd killing protein)
MHAEANRAAVARFVATQGLTIQAVRVPAQVVRHLRVAPVDVPAAAAECVAAAAECAVAAVVECAAVAVVDMPAAAGTGNL